MPRPPNCIKCGQPLESYTLTLTGVEIVVPVAWDADAGKYVEDEDGGNQNGGHPSCSCLNCGAEIPDPQEG